MGLELGLISELVYKSWKTSGVAGVSHLQDTQKPLFIFYQNHRPNLASRTHADTNTRQENSRQERTEGGGGVRTLWTIDGASRLKKHDQIGTAFMQPTRGTLPSFRLFIISFTSHSHVSSRELIAQRLSKKAVVTGVSSPPPPSPPPTLPVCEITNCLAP